MNNTKHLRPIPHILAYPN